MMIEPVLGFDHPRAHGLGREELMVEVERQRAAPCLWLDSGHRMPIVLGGIVDQHGDRAVPVLDLGDRGPQRRDVGGVADEKLGAGRRRRRSAGRLVDVDEGHDRPLRREGFDHLGPDAGGAPGDQHIAPLERGVANGMIGRGRFRMFGT